MQCLSFGARDNGIVFADELLALHRRYGSEELPFYYFLCALAALQENLIVVCIVLYRRRFYFGFVCLRRRPYTSNSSASSCSGMPAGEKNLRCRRRKSGLGGFLLLNTYVQRGRHLIVFQSNLTLFDFLRFRMFFFSFFWRDRSIFQKKEGGRASLSLRFCLVSQLLP